MKTIKKVSKEIADIINNPPQDDIHIDEWLDSSGKEFYSEVDINNDIVYAKFVLEYMRMPSYKILGFSRFMKDHKLFCTYEGKRYRVTMASRLGWIGLRLNHKAEHGYDVCAYPNNCYNWSKTA